MPGNFGRLFGLSSRQLTVIGAVMAVVLVLGVGMGIVLNSGVPESGEVRVFSSGEDGAQAGEEQTPVGSMLLAFSKVLHGGRTPAKPPFAARGKRQPGRGTERMPKAYGPPKKAVGGTRQEKLEPREPGGEAGRGVPRRGLRGAGDRP